MNLFQIIVYIYKYPLTQKHKIKSVFVFLKWQLSQRILQLPVIYKLTGNAKLILRKGRTGATGNLYLGLMELSEMGFLLHFLQPNDLFVDVGANVGTFTILASAERKARTIAIEPVPSTYECLLENVCLNNLNDNVELNNIGISSSEGKLFFTKNLDSINHVSNEKSNDDIEVCVSKLDVLLNNRSPILIKIDVEGYEYEVIRGSENILKTPDLKAIIIELAGLGEKYGFNENEIHLKLLSYGFLPFQYNPITRKLNALAKPSSESTIYIRDEDFVKDRLRLAPNISIGLFKDTL